jgi:hypothetical protein
VLLSYHRFETGRLEGPLAPLLLLQQAGAAGCQLYTWRCKPPPGMGPADFWHTLQTKGVFLVCGCGWVRAVVTAWLQGAEH